MKEKKLFLADCPICFKTIDISKDESFLMEYKKGLEEKMIKDILFFHPKCFISMAGIEWAKKMGYKE